MFSLELVGHLNGKSCVIFVVEQRLNPESSARSVRGDRLPVVRCVLLRFDRQETQVCTVG